MKLIKYFFQFIIVFIFFIFFKLLGYKKSSDLSGILFKKVGSLFRSQKIIKENLSNISITDNTNLKKIIDKIWENYGRIFSDYVFIKDFRKGKLQQSINIKGLNILEKIKSQNKPVIFVSGHFNNFELMAMIIEKNGIDLSAIYRPLNNIFLNKVMEKIRKNYICKKQIPKGKIGTRNLLKAFNKGSSIAIMIDQRVSEGSKIPFFKEEALTTTIPAQLIKRFNCDVVPVYIERINDYNFTISFFEPIRFNTNDKFEEITLRLNKWLEKMILKNPTQWIWTHNRWKL
jgi:KDO2-lipid IV(A) lauroyltransferase